MTLTIFDKSIFNIFVTNRSSYYLFNDIRTIILSLSKKNSSLQHPLQTHLLLKYRPGLVTCLASVFPNLFWSHSKAKLIGDQIYLKMVLPTKIYGRFSHGQFFLLPPFSWPLTSTSFVALKCRLLHIQQELTKKVLGNIVSWLGKIFIVHVWTNFDNNIWFSSCMLGSVAKIWDNLQNLLFLNFCWFLWQNLQCWCF